MAVPMAMASYLPTCVSYEVVSCECEIFGVFIGEGIRSHGSGLRVIMSTVPCKKGGKGERGLKGGREGCKEGGWTGVSRQEFVIVCACVCLCKKGMKDRDRDRNRGCNRGKIESVARQRRSGRQK